jgi:hypothetical protein
MMNASFYLILLFVLLGGSKAWAQQYPAAVGGRAFAMGNAIVVSSDVWATFNNVAGLASQQNVEAAVAVQQPYGFTALQTIYAGASTPLPRGGALGISAMRFGSKLFSEQAFGLAFAHKISMVSIGVKASYFQQAVQDPTGVSSRTQGAFIFEIGGIAQLLPALHWGMHAYNLGQARMVSDYREEYLPVVLKTGIGYHPTENLWLNIEAEKDTAQPTRVKAGFEYRVAKPFYMRTGVQTQPFVNTFGIGVRPKKMAVDYGLMIHNPLGLVHHISVSYAFR